MNATAISKLLSINIKRSRKERKLTQEQLAEAVGISTRHLSDIERSDAFPSPEVIEQIAAELGVPSYTLFLPSEENRVEVVYTQNIKTMLDTEISKALRTVAEKLSTE